MFVSTSPHYHWIMVIINMPRPGGVLAVAEAVSLFPGVSALLQCVSVMSLNTKRGSCQLNSTKYSRVLILWTF